MLATDGGLVFTGEFLALDADTGKTLWQFKVSSSVNSTAITYTHKGTIWFEAWFEFGAVVAFGIGLLLMPIYA
jgi:hypothetical protein